MDPCTAIKCNDAYDVQFTGIRSSNTMKHATPAPSLVTFSLHPIEEEEEEEEEEESCHDKVLKCTVVISKLNQV